ncbi:Uncharacterized protein SCF082_LOCUS33567 [Durusdinium trenchii]|uniref:Uncharacterized protein n=1 Tax=Durusdinium trenchii TaxID=1381693 RepID=A0ABP0NPK3_9DINO
MHRDLDGILWALRALGAPKDFMWLVVLVWFTEGLYDLQKEKHTVKSIASRGGCRDTVQPQQSVRIYPEPFGEAVARINDDLKRTRACFLNLLPVGYPTGPQTMQTTPDTSDFSQARLAECFKYIRGAKTLNLPPVPEEEYPLSGVDEDPYNDCLASLEPRSIANPRVTAIAGSGLECRVSVLLERWPKDCLRRNCYDGVMEYWVCVRESGSHEESLEVLETKRSREQAQESKLEIAPDSFKAVNAYKERGYTKSLNDNIKTLDTEFDKLNDLVAEGENSDFGKE